MFDLLTLQDLPVLVRRHDDATGEIVRQRRLDPHVPRRVLRLRDERYVAEDAREPEHVLILVIASVAPLQHLDRKRVGSRQTAVGRWRVEIRSDVKLRGEHRVFGIADLPSVDPDGIGRSDAFEAQDDASALPGLGNRKGRPIGRDGVVVGLFRRIVENERRLLGMGIGDVGVMRDAVSAVLDAARHVDRTPVRIVKVWALEARDALFGRTAPAVLPDAVQRLCPFRGGRNEITGRQAVDGIDRRILPRQGERQQGSKNVAHGICLLFLQ